MSVPPLHNRADHVGALHAASHRFHRTRAAMVEAARQLDRELHETGHGDRQPNTQAGDDSAHTTNPAT